MKFFSLDVTFYLQEIEVAFVLYGVWASNVLRDEDCIIEMGKEKYLFCRGGHVKFWPCNDFSCGYAHLIIYILQGPFVPFANPNRSSSVN